MDASTDVEMSNTLPEVNGTQAPAQASMEPIISTAEHMSTIQPAATPNLAALQSTPAPRTGSMPPTQPSTVRPDKPVLHGGPTRQYLNQNITPHLLEGMKFLAMNEPEKPLAWLANFLQERSKQVEG